MSKSDAFDMAQVLEEAALHLPDDGEVDAESVLGVASFCRGGGAFIWRWRDEDEAPCTDSTEG